LKRFKGELFNALVEIIPNFCSRKTGVEFSIACVEGIDIVILGTSKLLVLVWGGGVGGEMAVEMLRNLKHFDLQRRRAQASRAKSPLHYIYYRIEY